jgi:phospholipase C
MPQMQTKALAALITSALALTLAGCAGTATVTDPTTAYAASASTPKKGLEQIKTVVVIYAENRSFDSLYGRFPGAEGLANATAEQMTQLDHDGKPLAVLPPSYHSLKVDPHLPSEMPNGPFRADLPPVNQKFTSTTPNPVHRFYQHQEQINGGRNNMFVAMGNTGAWTMANYDGSHLKLWQWAKEYALADHFFQSAFGGSFLNHQWLACACTPVWRDAPASLRAQLDAAGKLKKKPTSPPSIMGGLVETFDGNVTPDGYVVNDVDPAYQPSKTPPAAGGDARLTDPAKHHVPPQTSKTLGDALSEKGVSWAWYSEGWNAALADGMQAPDKPRVVIDPRGMKDSLYFQPPHSPYNYFANFAPGTDTRARHLLDGSEFFTAVEKGTLPQVSFFKPVGRVNQHSRYSTIAAGDEHLSNILTKLRASPQWNNMVVIVTYDEFGGYWDHVPPPAGEGWGDRWGPGSRIATLVISPFSKKGFIDKTVYDTTSIHKFINARFGLTPLPGVRAKVGDLTNSLQF